jgi:hypothetical protein
LISATSLRSSILSALSSLSELTSTLTLLPSSTGISSLARLTCLACLAAGILRTLWSSCSLAGQTAVQDSRKLPIDCAGTLTAPASLTASAGVRLPQ